MKKGQSVQIFEEVLFFKRRTTLKQKKKKNQLIQLILSQLDARRLVEGKVL